MLTPKEKLLEVIRLKRKNRILTIVQVVGVLVLLTIQIIVSVNKLFPPEVLIWYPLAAIALWGITFVVLIGWNNFKASVLTEEVSRHVREVIFETYVASDIMMFQFIIILILKEPKAAMDRMINP